MSASASPTSRTNRARAAPPACHPATSTTGMFCSGDCTVFEYHHAVGKCQQAVAGAPVAARRCMKSVVVAILLLAARTVNAQSPAAPTAFTPEYGIGLVAGAGTPIGGYGVEGMYAP